MATSLRIHDHDVVVSSGLVRVGRLEQEWYKDVVNPQELIAQLTDGPGKADIFTFWQRLPDLTPRYSVLHGAGRRRGTACHVL